MFLLYTEQNPRKKGTCEPGLPRPHLLHLCLFRWERLEDLDLDTPSVYSTMVGKNPAGAIKTTRPRQDGAPQL